MRPSGLPDFKNPPLNEVVVGVQYTPARGYSQIRAGEVWNLFKQDYPLIEEQAPLQPQFETFGLPTPPAFNFGLVSGVQHDRFWFLSKDKHELIQFQEDRLLHNWRQVEGQPEKPYPRFESILEKYTGELEALSEYFNGLHPQRLTFTQAEVTYTNNIVMDDDGEGANHSAWLSFLNANLEAEPDDIICVMRRALFIEGAPIARISVDARTGYNSRQQRVIFLNITLRGNPPNGTLADVVGFLKLGRDVIVKEFADVTTAYAHQRWGRVA